MKRVVLGLLLVVSLVIAMASAVFAIDFDDPMSKTIRNPIINSK